jgi:hypothetical protein
MADVPGALRVTFSVGYASVPDALQAAVKLALGELYRQREADAGTNVAEHPALRRLVHPFRVGF